MFWQCTRMWVVSPVSVDLFDRLVWMENGRYQSRQVSLTKTTMEMCHQRQSDVTATEFDDVYVKKKFTSERQIV